MKTIQLTQGKVALVDDEHHEALAALAPWHFNRRSGMASTATGELMHREVLRLAGRESGVFTDHEDRNRLNNQLGNLRRCTKSQNMANRGKTKANTSGFKGVTWSKPGRKWTAQIMHEGRRIYLGLFHNRKDAAVAYDEAARELFKEFACLNFPD